MINTLNETHLHKTIKSIYSLREEGSKTEEKVGSYIADIVTKDGNIIEIQTGNLAGLAPKIKTYLEENRKVTVVYPLVFEKLIETTDIKDLSVKKTKSPKKQDIYYLFKELTKLYPFLLKRNFTLEVPLVKITEERKITEEAIQSKNGRRRFKKNWIKSGKRLEETRETYVFKSKKNYLSLIPKETEKPFTVNSLYKVIKEKGSKAKRDNISLMIWLYLRMGIIEEKEKNGRSRSFTF